MATTTTTIQTTNESAARGSRGGHAAALDALGVCALVGAATTLVNTVLPNFYSADGFDARVALIRDPFYAARQWVLLVHPAFTLLGALGVALALWRRSPGPAAAGYTFAFVEKLTEFLLGVTILFVVNGVWKARYLARRGSPAGDLLRARIEGFNDVLGGAYFLLWWMFILSTALLALGVARSRPRDVLARGFVWTGALTIGLTVCMMLGTFAGQEAWTAPLIRWCYPPLLTLHRGFMGLWLRRRARDGEGGA